METVTVRQGTARSLTITLANSAGPLAYVGTETLEAIVWAGDDMAALATLAPTWLDASAGTVSLAIPAATTTALDPQAYTISLTVVSAGVTYEGWRAWLRIESGPGTADPAAVWCSYDDMLRFASWLDQIQGESDTAGFAEQRARATEWAIEQGMSRARDMLESQYQRHAARYNTSTITWVIPDSGVDLGPQWGRSSYVEPQMLVDFNAWRARFDDTDIVVVDSRMKEIVARYAIAMACDQQIGEQGKTSYQELAARFRNRAIQLMAGHSWRFLTPGDANHPELRLD
jgi:hypothetical protein